MPHGFEITDEVTTPASPEQAWQAVATGPGLDSWFMGANQVEPRLGGRARADFGAFTSESTVTAWEPPRHVAYRGEGEDGTFMVFEYLIEGRDGGTVIRVVHSGVLGGDWEAELDALRKGDPMYVRTLGQYLAHFRGRTATPVQAWGPQQPDQERVWEGLKRGLGLRGTVSEGDVARFSPNGSGTVEGVVDSVLAPNFLGVRTGDALYRFAGRGGMIGTGHHLFAGGVDRAEAERTWEAWLARLFA
jgi:uncharacterized protein YndB with AHSA1/START domain